MLFNFKTKAKDVTTNHVGAKAFKMTPEMALYSAVATSTLSDSYYEKAGEHLTRLQTLIGQNDPEFVAKLAVYAREQMYMRSVPLVLAIELAKNSTGNNLVSRTLTRTIQRADELTEALAFYQVSNERTSGAKKLNRLSKQVQKGLAGAFNKFDEYQFAKYNRKDTTVKLRDALFLVHPKAINGDKQAIFDKIATDTLATPYTWEVELSVLGQQKFEDPNQRAQAFAAKWEDLVMSNKLGYMAILRNLRNILTDGSDAAFEVALETIEDKHKVLKSKQLPFRFLSAYAEIEKLKTADNSVENSDIKQNKSDLTKITKALQAIEKAVIYSVDNLPNIGGKTLILSDNSGSMRGDAGGASLVSAMSKRTTADIANLFAALYHAKASDTMIGLFGDRLVTPKIDAQSTVFDTFKILDTAAQTCGPGTETGIFTMLEQLIKEKIMVDRIVIFSDCQIGKGCNWYDTNNRRANDFDALFQKYKAINPQVMTYSINLKGYDTTVFNENVMTVSGWSDKIFTMIAALEKGSSVVEEIMNIELN
jgi:60 kDa SS-A/Ro ribonucleoprotein